MAVKSLAHHIRGKHIKVFCVNTTAVNYVNQMGGTKSTSCNDICQEIWEWCAENDAWITCSHIPGRGNCRRCISKVQWQTWMEVEDIFRELCEFFGVPSIDLFLSRLNKQVPHFCSWQPDSDAEHFNAFFISWSQFDSVYIFPPFVLIVKCLKKMCAEMARGWLIVPLWPSQPWMGTRLKMLINEPQLIMRRKDVLQQLSAAEDHPIMKHARLMVYLLSGNSYEQEAYRWQVWTSSWPPGEQQRRNSIDHMSTSGYNFVTKGTSIPWLPL